MSRPLKLTKQQVHELQMLYVHEGWHIVELAQKYDVHHTSVLYHIRHLERAHPPRDMRRSKQWSPTYEEYLAEEERRRAQLRAQCAHEEIAIICIRCGKHFEQTKTQPARAKILFI